MFIFLLNTLNKALKSLVKEAVKEREMSGIKLGEG